MTRKPGKDSVPAEQRAPKTVEKVRPGNSNKTGSASKKIASRKVSRETRTMTATSESPAAEAIEAEPSGLEMIVVEEFWIALPAPDSLHDAVASGPIASGPIASGPIAFGPMDQAARAMAAADAAARKAEQSVAETSRSYRETSREANEDDL